MAFGLALADIVRELVREIVRETGVLEREAIRWPSGSRLNPGIVAASQVCLVTVVTVKPIGALSVKCPDSSVGDVCFVKGVSEVQVEDSRGQLKPHISEAFVLWIKGDR